MLYEIQMFGALAGYIRTGEVDEAVADLTYRAYRRATPPSSPSSSTPAT